MVTPVGKAIGSRGCRGQTMTPTQLHCDDCNEPVRVEKRKAVGLLMTCDCDDTLSIKTAMALPREWSA